MELDDKVAVVTGAAAGFGAGIARRFAAAGAAVIVADIDRDGGERVVAAIGEAGGRARFVAADVTAPDQVEAMVAAAADSYGGIDVLVQNAGIVQPPMELVDTPEALFDRLFLINVKSAYLGARAAVPVMRRQGRGGAIVNMVSTAAIRPRPMLAAYNATKGALMNMTRSLAVELAGDRIRVNGICPVAGDTAMLGIMAGGEPIETVRRRFVATIPLGRLSRPEDVAAAALYLASDAADMVTGVMLEVDGGRCI